jgi:hypothetical protein
MFGPDCTELDRLKLEMRGFLGFTPDYSRTMSIVPAIGALESSRYGAIICIDPVAGWSPKCIEAVPGSKKDGRHEFERRRAENMNLGVSWLYQ